MGAVNGMRPYGMVHLSLAVSFFFHHHPSVHSPLWCSVTHLP